MLLQPFLDLKNSKACTHVCNLLNLSDLKKVAKILFKNTKYYKKSENLHATLDSQVPTFLVITRRSWQPLAAPGSYKANLFLDFCPWKAYNRHTRRSWQLQSS